MDKIIRIEILDLLLKDSLQKKSSIKIRLKDLLRKLQEKNPIYFVNASKNGIKKELVIIYPIHNNMKKNTKWFKITKPKTIEYILKQRINITGL
jgi:hypothetical protein